MTGGACEGGEGEHGAAEPGAEVDPGGQNRWLDINFSILQQNPLIIDNHALLDSSIDLAFLVMYILLYFVLILLIL